MNMIADIRKAISSLYPQYEAEAVARMIAEDIFGFSLTDCLADRVTLSVSQQAQLESVIRRLQSGEPVQYIIGSTVFCGHRFLVTPSVLIPRPETEDLVNLILCDVGDCSQQLDVCDAGTGSGCIAISLQKAMPQSRVTALDISQEALEVARRNAMENCSPVHFLQADMLSTTAMPDGPWDVIVSNPPYVMDCEKAAMSVQVKHYEPSAALFVPDDNALLYYAAIAQWGYTTLSPRGVIYCELNSSLATETEQLFRRYGFTQVSLQYDRYNKYRFIKCGR